MSGQTVTRADLAEAVFSEVGLSRNDSALIVDSVLDEIVGALVSGENVKISSFATFTLRDKKARIGRNPRTGKEAQISSRRVVLFRPSTILKKNINT
jgi:integration host factor subunit alpha